LSWNAVVSRYADPTRFRAPTSFGSRLAEGKSRQLCPYGAFPRFTELSQVTIAATVVYSFDFMLHVDTVDAQYREK
jgi:hypothetical protein